MNERLNLASSSSSTTPPSYKDNDVSDDHRIVPTKGLKRRNSLKIDDDPLDHAQIDVVVDSTVDSTVDESLKILSTMVVKTTVLIIQDEKSSFNEWKHLCNGPHSQIYKSNLVPSASQPVVIKILKEKSAENLTALREFDREKQVLLRINHENIVDLYAYGLKEDGKSTPFLVLERLVGSTLSSILKEPR